jgi:hypothetical protein
MYLENLIGNVAATKLRTRGLHKIAADRLRSDGHAITGDLDLKAAIQALGTNVFLKNAQYKRIFEGLVTLDNLTNGV